MTTKRQGPPTPPPRTRDFIFELQKTTLFQRAISKFGIHPQLSGKPPQVLMKTF